MESRQKVGLYIPRTIVDIPVAMIQMKTITIFHLYLFLRQLMQTALSIIETIFLNKSYKNQNKIKTKKLLY